MCCYTNGLLNFYLFKTKVGRKSCRRLMSVACQIWKGRRTATVVLKEAATRKVVYCGRGEMM